VELVFALDWVLQLFHVNAQMVMMGLDVEVFFFFLISFWLSLFIYFLFTLWSILTKKIINEAVYCPSQTENDSKTKWNQVLATGVTINGQCLDGYDGIISRQCIQSGSTGNWGPISGSCVGIILLSLSFL